MKKDKKEQANENLGVIICHIYYERNPKNFRLGDLVLFHNDDGTLSYVHAEENGPLRNRNIRASIDALEGLRDGTKQLLGAVRTVQHIHQKIL